MLGSKKVCGQNFSLFVSYSDPYFLTVCLQELSICLIYLILHAFALY